MIPRTHSAAEVAAFAKLHGKIQIVLILEGVVDGDDEGAVLERLDHRELLNELR